MLVRYADDLVVLCHTKREAEAVLAALRSVLAEMGLELKQAKTGIARPSREAMQRARDRIREITDQRRLLLGSK